MKKKKIVALLIVIGIIITSFSIRGTYAKYKSSIDLNSTARVAKWGINTSQVIDLFKDSYDLEGIKSLDGSKIIAPGSSGKYTFKISGSAEVSYGLKFQFDVEDTINQLEYYLTIEDGEEEGPTTLQSIADDLTEFYSFDNTFAPNEEVEVEHTIRWIWPLNDTEDSNKADSDLTKQVIIDKNDANYGSQPHVKFKVNISAEQKN